MTRVSFFICDSHNIHWKIVSNKYYTQYCGYTDRVAKQNSYSDYLLFSYRTIYTSFHGQYAHYTGGGGTVGQNHGARYLN